MDANYDPKKYGARINLGHIKFRFYQNDESHSQVEYELDLKPQETEDGKLYYWHKSSQ